MMRKKYFTMLTAAALVVFSGQAAGEDGPGASDESMRGPAYAYNASASTVHWEGSKPGGKHHGTIQVVNGTALTDGDQIVGGTFELDMSTILNEDVKNDGMRERLLNHLKSEDFFYVEKYPTSSFKITNVKQMKDEPSMHMVTGELTIRGNTHEVSFPAEITMDDSLIRAQSGQIVLDRTRWEVNHQSKSVFSGLKDNFIHDEMIVRLDVHLNRN